MTVEEIERVTMEKIDTIIESYGENLKKIQVGRVDPVLFENIAVTDYDKKTTLKKIASMHMIDEDTLEIKPYMEFKVQEVQKALNGAKKDLTIKFNVLPDKKRLLLKFDLTITRELRQSIVEICERKTEEFKINLRTLRHDMLKKLKEIIKNDEEFKKQSKKIQVNFDKANKILDDKLKNKTDNIMGA